MPCKALQTPIQIPGLLQALQPQGAMDDYNVMSDEERELPAMPATATTNTSTNAFRPLKSAGNWKLGLAAASSGGNTAASKPFKRAKANGSSLQDANKEEPAKRPRPKLDFERLLKDPRGFKFLRLQTESVLRLSGGRRGCELGDLVQVVTFLHEWTRKLFPKLSLGDCVHQIEKVCTTTVMRDYMRQLRAAAMSSARKEDFDAEFLVSRSTAQVEAMLAKTTAASNPSRALSGTETGDFGDDELNRLLLAKEPKTRPAEYADDSMSNGETSADESDEEMRAEMADFINDNEDEDAPATRSDSEASAQSEAESASETELAVHGDYSELQQVSAPGKRRLGIIFDDDEDNE
jgi:hypothetical protein